MIWEYTLIALCLGVVFSILSFHYAITPAGRVLFIFLGGMFFFVSAFGLLKIEYIWGGSNNVVTYTYIPDEEAWWLPYPLGVLASLLFIIGTIKIILNPFANITTSSDIEVE